MQEEKEYEFWPDKVAKELIKNWSVEKHVITTGTSMSGDPHIGNANDIIRGDAVYRALLDMGQKAELTWISDDLDPFRSVPQGMPKEMENYLGMPAASIPDFWGCHKNFANHFEEKFISQFEKIYVEPKIYLAVEMYKKGMYNNVLKIAMSKRKEIAAILNNFRERPLPEDWYPVDVICDNCGKISTTKIICYDEKKSEVEYVCSTEEIILQRKNPISGCGNISRKSILDGGAKLTWRVEWPARWSFLKTTCEPFGKEHAASGGSWDVGRIIVKEIFGWNPPYPVIYEHIQVEGQKMSKSKGNVITVDQMLRYLRPEHIRYWLYQGRLTLVKDINFKNMVPNLWNEFDKAEDVYFGVIKIGSKRQENNYKRAYQLSLKSIKSKRVIHIDFNKLVEIVKIMPENNFLDFAISKLKEWNFIKELDSADKKELEERIVYVKRYCEEILKIKKEIEKVEINENMKKALMELIREIEIEIDGEKIQQKLFDISKRNNVEVKEFFKTIYKIILGSERGPRLGPYIIEVGKKEIIEKIKKYI